MFIKQLTVFVENKSGRLSAVMEAFGANGIDISALSLADTADFGLLRMIVNKPYEALEVLHNQGIIAKITDVIAIAVDDTPGGLTGALAALANDGISIEYMYAFMGSSGKDALVVIRADDNNKTLEACKKDGIKTGGADVAYKY